MTYIKSIPVTCPHCNKPTRITPKRITDDTPILHLPNWERGKCEHCKGEIIVFLDVQIAKVDKYS